jgi:glycosyltransferase involved in cell wall biosynthesis
MKRRIALVISHPIQHFCPQYASFASNKNVEFKVFFGSMLGLKKYFDPNFKKEISWNDLNLDQFEHVFVNGDQILASDENLDAPALDVRLDEFKPDLIITYGYFQTLQRRAHRWALKNKVKLAYISDSELRHKRNRLKELLKYLFIKKYFSKINYFLSVGEANEDFYKFYGVESDRTIRMHFPINVVQFEARYTQSDELREQIRTQHKIEKEEIVLSVVGKLVPWKNQDHIIDAMKVLEDEGAHLHLFVLGSGETFDNLKQKASLLKRSVVHFPGFVSPEDLPSYYAATDIYVHPASQEPHSIAISEAIYMGCPVVLSNRCGSYGDSDDVQESKNGLVYEFGKIDELASKLKLLATNDEMRLKFREHSIQISRQFQNTAHFAMFERLNGLLNVD